MQVTLTPDIEEALIKQAGKTGTTPEILVLEVLREHLSEMQEPDELSSNKTLAEFLGDQIGSLATGDYVPGSANLSEHTGKRFTEILLKNIPA
jgi:hypothetical protein